MLVTNRGSWTPQPSMSAWAWACTCSQAVTPTVRVSVTSSWAPGRRTVTTVEEVSGDWGRRRPSVASTQWADAAAAEGLGDGLAWGDGLGMVDLGGEEPNPQAPSASNASS